MVLDNIQPRNDFFSNVFTTFFNLCQSHLHSALVPSDLHGELFFLSVTTKSDQRSKCNLLFSETFVQRCNLPPL